MRRWAVVVGMCRAPSGSCVQ